MGAKIGIIIGSIVVVLFLAGFTLVWWKKRQRKIALKSKYDARYGAPEISSPIANQGAFINLPYHSTPSKINTFVRYSPKEFKDAEDSPGKPISHSPANTDFSTASSSQPSSPFSVRAMPVHQAYIPTKSGLTSTEPLSPPTLPVPGHNRKASKSTAPYSPLGQSTSAKSSPTNRAPYDYNPLKYVPSEKEPAYRTPAAKLRPQPGRQQAWNVDSAQSVELWPGTM